MVPLVIKNQILRRYSFINPKSQTCLALASPMDPSPLCDYFFKSFLGPDLVDGKRTLEYASLSAKAFFTTRKKYFMVLCISVLLDVISYSLIGNVQLLFTSRQLYTLDGVLRVSMDYAFCTFWRILTHSGAF